MGRWLALLFLFLPAMAEASCPSFWSTGTFLQLYESDNARSTEEWRAAMARWKRQGAQHLILQWAAYGAPGTNSFPLIEEGTIKRLLDAAAANGTQVHLGLRYDPDFWAERAHDESGLGEQRLQPPSDLTRYLFMRERDLEALVNALAPLAIHPAFGGWYISDEIDDGRWLSDGRRALIGAYLKKIVNLLKERTPDAAVALSAFSNGLLPPRELAEFLQHLAHSSGIDHLLFQDGIGAGKLELSELSLYIPALAEQFAHSTVIFTVIVELFQQDSLSENFTAAPFERIRLQLQQAAESGAASFTFALPHHADTLEPAGDLLGLGAQLLTLKERCGL
ncbi:MAG TPA: DUF4434 domain-containing protein [Kiloniellales bacterium]|mgnify:FL=1|nr:DUF4434 domain-containing protein [Kiloniellales bacterium]